MTLGDLRKAKVEDSQLVVTVFQAQDLESPWTSILVPPRCLGWVGTVGYL